MRNALALSMIVLLAFVGGCKQNEQRQTAKVSASEQVAPGAHELTPEQLGELGAQIQKSPARAGELLSRHGLNEETFEKQIRRITENPDASKRYAAAYRKASA